MVKLNMKLHPHLPFDASETVESYVRRLSLFHTGRDGLSLLKDLAIDQRALLSGSDDAFAKLADATGTAVDVLMSGMFLHKKRYRKFRGEICNVNFLQAEGFKVCPECLKDDGSSGHSWALKGRMAWRLRSLQTCTLHNCRLIKSTDKGGDVDAQAIFMNLVNICDLMTDPQAPTALELSIANRLTGSLTGAGEWLDKQTVEQGVKVCEMIGATLNHGLQFNPNGLTAEEWRQAGAIGFEFACQGQKAVYGALSSISARATTTAGQAGPKAIYGKLFEWLAYGSQLLDFGPIRDLVRDHILDTIVVEPGQILLGEPVVGRRLHSVYSLSLHTGLHRKGLRKILVQAGHASDDSWDLAAHRLVFDADNAEKLCCDIIDSISLHFVPEAIGCSRTQAESLYREEVIRPVIATDVSNKIGKLAFARRDLTKFLDAIGQLPETTMDCAYLVNFVSATKRTGQTTGFIMNRVFEGKLVAYRNGDDISVNSIRFCIDDLDSIRTRQAKPPEI